MPKPPTSVNTQQKHISIPSQLTLIRLSISFNSNYSQSKRVWPNRGLAFELSASKGFAAYALKYILAALTPSIERTGQPPWHAAKPQF